MFFDRFHFIDPTPLIDGDFELLAPEEWLIDEVLTSCGHPLTQLYAPLDSQITREQLTHFVKSFPFGHEPANASAGRVCQYHFWMRLRDGCWGTPAAPPIRVVGGIGLRLGSTPTIELYYGHLGYHVYPAARGRHYALRACRLLLPLARHHGYKHLWITCNPENTASRRTCEQLGGKLVEVIPVPENEPLFARGELWKCRYKLDLPRQ
ncbi:MAG TPA: GNAT family N-acetyltransferase [Tepidisphaeraceae bacterium]|nr:GNAT family N-acetyltransferase [Tepidisphaeraceae bacterium]